MQDAYGIRPPMVLFPIGGSVSGKRNNTKLFIVERCISMHQEYDLNGCCKKIRKANANELKEIKRRKRK